MLRFSWHACLGRQVGESSRIGLPGLKIHHFGGQQMLTPCVPQFPPLYSRHAGFTCKCWAGFACGAVWGRLGLRTRTKLKDSCLNWAL